MKVNLIVYFAYNEKQESEHEKTTSDILDCFSEFCDDNVFEFQCIPRIGEEIVAEDLIKKWLENKDYKKPCSESEVWNKIYSVLKTGTFKVTGVMVKSETTAKDGFDVIQNRFFIKGEGDILYNYNHGVMASDPKTAAQNFLNALDTMPKLLERYQADNEKLQKDIPVLKEVVEGTWRKEPELKALKDDLIKLDREIQLSLKPIEETEGKESVQDNSVSVGNQIQSQGKTETSFVQDTPLPNTIQGVKEIMGDRLVIASVGSSPPKVEKKDSSKGIKL